MGVPFEYETKQLEYYVSTRNVECQVCGEKKKIIKHGKYTPDFITENLIIEAKGIWDAPDRKKMRAIREQLPELKIVMVFQVDKWITSKRRKKYSDVCNEIGIPFCIGIQNIEKMQWKF